MLHGPPSYKVAVRALCEFTAKAGDLDLRFVPAPTAEQGIAGHALVASRRGAGWQAEYPLAGRWGPLAIAGRADGWNASAGRLEEIKTHRGDLALQPANHRALHWAQLKVYGALLCAAEGRAAVELALCYLDIGSGRETVFTETASAADLAAFLDDQCRRFVDWAEQEIAHRVARDAALATLAFPHADFRPGQRTLAEAVYRGAASGRVVAAQAPTGIGKTVGTLYPLLRALPTQGIDQIAYLAAKTPGRALALHAIDTLLQHRAAARPPEGGERPLGGERATRSGERGGSIIRVVELVARDKACEHPEAACHGASCPLAAGFYDRLPAARAEAANDPAPQTRERMRATALAHGVCPYYLAQELARWADVVVGDYHYWFDTHALLFALAQQRGTRVALLVDEAHNLIDRARGMYSAELALPALKAAKKGAPRAVARALNRLATCWPGDGGYRVLDDLPPGFAPALQAVAAAVAEHQSADPAAIGPALLQLHFDILAFTRLWEVHGSHSLLDAEGPTITLRNVVPAPFLKSRFAAAHSATLFSATLSPRPWQQDLLGLPTDTAWLDVPSPFDAAQLAVRIARPVSTRWRDRAASLAPIAALIARQFAAAPGNYLAFFSSHDYLQQALAALQAAHPHIPTWAQARGMAEAARQDFLTRFAEGGQGVGFAVLGGAFAEGIDLPGTRLVGAFVATLGLPQVNPQNEAVAAAVTAHCGHADAAHYSARYPGLQKVVQAAGRVIRTGSDTGCVWLMDDRFDQPAIRALLPAWWDVQVVHQLPAL